MGGNDLALQEFLAFFLHKLGVQISPDFVVSFRRRRKECSKLEPSTWKFYDNELNKLMTEDERNWKWRITDKG